MRIAVWHNLPSGGGKRALYDHVTGLLSLGHEVESWCPPTADQDFLPLGSIVKEHILPLPERDPTYKERGLSFLSGGRYLDLLELDALRRHSAMCAEEIDGSDFDVVLGCSSIHFAVTALATLLLTPAVLYLQEPYRWLYEALPQLPWIAPDRNVGSFRKGVARAKGVADVEVLRVIVREELAGVRAYKRVLANSYFSRESLLRAYGVDADVCYLGIDTARYIDHGYTRDHMVIGLGQFSPHKRIDVAIRAVAELGTARPALAWIGNVVSGTYLDDLRTLATDVGVDFQPHVGVNHDQVVLLLNKAKCMLYAPHLEPFGYAPLEAAACGLPVVSRAEGGVRETVIDGLTGRLVDRDSDLAGALGALLDDSGTLRQMRREARRTVVERWSLEAASARLEGHLLAVAGR